MKYNFEEHLGKEITEYTSLKDIIGFDIRTGKSIFGPVYTKISTSGIIAKDKIGFFIKTDTGRYPLYEDCELFQEHGINTKYVIKQ